MSRVTLFLCSAAALAVGPLASLLVAQPAPVQPPQPIPPVQPAQPAQPAQPKPEGDKVRAEIERIAKQIAAVERMLDEYGKAIAELKAQTPVNEAKLAELALLRDALELKRNACRDEILRLGKVRRPMSKDPLAGIPEEARQKIQALEMKLEAALMDQDYAVAEKLRAELAEIYQKAMPKPVPQTQPQPKPAPSEDSAVVGKLFEQAMKLRQRLEEAQAKGDQAAIKALEAELMQMGLRAQAWAADRLEKMPPQAQEIAKKIVAEIMAAWQANDMARVKEMIGELQRLMDRVAGGSAAQPKPNPSPVPGPKPDELSVPRIMKMIHELEMQARKAEEAGQKDVAEKFRRELRNVMEKANRWYDERIAQLSPANRERAADLSEAIAEAWRASNFERGMALAEQLQKLLDSGRGQKPAPDNVRPNPAQPRQPKPLEPSGEALRKALESEIATVEQALNAVRAEWKMWQNMDSPDKAKRMAELEEMVAQLISHLNDLRDELKRLPPK